MPPLLNLERSGSDVRVTAKSWTAGTTFFLVYNAGCEWAARLLLSDLDQALCNRMEKIRREAYAQGWKDAKARRRKETWFSGELP